ncbi:MAG: hypothetical protein M3069_30050 [Chloroflexota bacterium]|nr:hypothetical protein [Chloroflexota bacterium]
MAEAPATDWHGDSPDLLVANTTWDRLLTALQETSGEQFTVRGSNINPWWGWLHESISAREWPLLGGEHRGRAYLLGQVIGPGATADRIPALAAAIDDVVLGYTYDDKTGWEQIVVADRQQLSRFRVISGWGEHSEGVALERESEGINGILNGLGFNPNACLDEGQVHRLTWTMLDPEQQAEAHRRLYLGPLRMRIDHIQQAGAEAIGAAYDDWTTEE